MADLSTGVPTRVWTKAQAYGLHDECVRIGIACVGCSDAIMRAFEDVYGGAETMDEVLGMIAYDLALADAKGLAA